MEDNKIVVRANDMEIVDGKVVISSEDLAAAIQSQEINLGAEEEAEWCIFQQNGCNNGC